MDHGLTNQRIRFHINSRDTKVKSQSQMGFPNKIYLYHMKIRLYINLYLTNPLCYLFSQPKAWKPVSKLNEMYYYMSLFSAVCCVSAQHLHLLQIFQEFSTSFNILQILVMQFSFFLNLSPCFFFLFFILSPLNFKRLTTTKKHNKSHTNNITWHKKYWKFWNHTHTIHEIQKTIIVENKGFLSYNQPTYIRNILLLLTIHNETTGTSNQNVRITAVQPLLVSAPHLSQLFFPVRS